MNRIVPGKTNQKLPIILKFNIYDIIYIVCGLIVIIATMLTMMALNIKPFAIIAGVIFAEGAIFLILLAQITEYRLYWYIRHLVLYIFSHKKYSKNILNDQLGLSFKENYVTTEAGQYSKVIEIKGIDFSLISEASQDLKINQLASVLGNIEKGKIVKLDKPISFLGKLEDVDTRLAYYAEEYGKLSEEEKKDPENLTAMQLESRITALTIDHNTFASAEEAQTIKSNAYYLILYNENLSNLNLELERSIRLLNNMGLFCYELDDKEIKEFYKNFFETEESQQEKSMGKLIFPETVEHARYLQQGDKKFCVHTLCDLPYLLGNGWLSYIANIEGVKLVVNFKNNTNLDKATKNINRKIVSLGALLLQKQTESDRMEINAQIDAFRSLLQQIKFSKETLHTCDIMLIYPYDKKLVKEINAIVKTATSARLDTLTFRQMEVYINAFPHLQSKNIKYMQRDFQSSTFAGSFPFISDLFVDDKGDFLGENSGPVFFDMWSNLNGGPGTRTNANIMTIGASGKGKSYLQKILIKNQLERDDKIFILDPENEYSYIARQFGGEVIDVVGGDMRINPFELVPEMDDSGKESAGFGLLSKQLAFLGDFFKVVLPYLTAFTRQVLQNELKTIYAKKGIFPVGYKNPKDKNAKPVLFRDAGLKSTDYPTFDDIIDHFYSINLSEQTTQVQEAVVELQAFLKDFEKDGRYGAIWNGPTTISLDNDFIVFNFRGLDNGSSDEIKNGQMLLITKYLNKEIINNFERNLHIKKSEAKKVVLLVDEAHNFIDPEFPVALDMMKNMAKRIRKYSGSLWVATQNIADFVGFDINTKTKATAVINNCQYTFLFGLKPNDIEQVKDMYSKSVAGALTEEELSYLATAGQGDVLLMVDTSTRISFHVTLKDRENESPLILPVEYSYEELAEDNNEEENEQN